MASSRFLTSASPLIKLLRSNLSPVVAAAPFTVRSFRTLSIPVYDTDSEIKPDNESGSESDARYRVPMHRNNKSLQNPFLMRGPHVPYEVKEDSEAMHVRLDMPGIGKEELQLWIEGGSLWVEGSESEGEKVALGQNDCPRKFYGEIELSEGCVYKFKKIKAKLKNGVLKVVIPKHEDGRSPVVIPKHEDERFPWMFRGPSIRYPRPEFVPYYHNMSNMY